MKRRALIIDDDKNFSESLTDILRKKNIDVKVVSSQLEMERSLDLEEYHLLIIDIILPKTNGIQLLRDVISKNLIHDGCHVWIVSGVLAKKAVPKDVMKHVNSFIKKPVSLEDINKKVSELFSDQSILDIPFFYLENKKQDILNNNEHQIEGHELMFICFYLCSINFTGDLLINILDMKEEKIITFKEGKITHINYSDPHSYIGLLLAKNHLVKKEDIKSLLEEKSDLSITERLLANCYISPHQLNKVLREQVAIRLFKIMGHSSLKVKCIKKNNNNNMDFTCLIELGKRELLFLLKNWILSKVKEDWLNSFFEQYGNLKLLSLDNKMEWQQLSHYPGLEFLNDVNVRSLEGKTLLELLNDDNTTTGNEKKRELYCQFLIKQIYFKPLSKTVENYDILRNKYKAFIKSEKLKNYFEIMNLSVDASDPQINKMYKNMVQKFHPDKRAKNMPSDVLKIGNQCFMLVNKIYDTLIDPDKKKQYLQTIMLQNKEKQFASAEVYREGKQLINSNRYSEALQKFTTILNQKNTPPDTSLYYIWAFLKTKSIPLHAKDKKKVYDMLDAVGLDNQQNALFLFVNGLFMKLTGNIKQARNYLAKANLLDSKMIVARIELSTLKNGKQKSFLAGLFKKGA